MESSQLLEDRIADVVQELDSDFDYSDEEPEPVELEQVSLGDTLPESTNTADVGNVLSSWSSGPHIPIIHEFDPFQSGITNASFNESSTPLDFFEHFLNKDLMCKIVEETNKFYSFSVSREQPKEASRLHKWVDINISEMYLFIGLSMLMTRNKHLTIEEFWSTDPLLKSSIFGKSMPRNRYELILQMLHFSDSTITVNDRLNKIKLVVDHTRKVFKSTLMPSQGLCIDESIIVFKGRLIFKQFIPSKRHRFGIKLFVLCDVETGYVLDFIIYCGESTDIEDQGIGISGSVVTTLLKDYFNKGHTLWCDNWYTSPQLFSYLHENGTNACGTVRPNRKEMPKFSKLKRGQIESKHRGPLLALKWCDKRDVHMLTTLHDDLMTQTSKINHKTGEPVIKPQCVLDYNKSMGIVDKADMMITSLSCMRKSLKWYKKVFFHIIDLYLLNAFLLYKTTNANKIVFAEFQLTVIREILQKYGPPLQLLTATPSTSNSDDFRKNFTRAEDHMPDFITPDKDIRKCRRRCCYCSKKKQKPVLTKFMCKTCDAPLCAVPCFKLYHKEKRYLKK
jgi:hypothetical protein